MTITGEATLRNIAANLKKHTPMTITVNPLWLQACGRQSHMGIPFQVLHVADHGKRGKMYEVLDKDGYPWVVWSKRGVHEHHAASTIEANS